MLYFLDIKKTPLFSYVPFFIVNNSNENWFKTNKPEQLKNVNYRFLLIDVISFRQKLLISGEFPNNKPIFTYTRSMLDYLL